MGLRSEERLERAGPAVSTEVDGSALILHTEDGTYYQLDGAGRRIWELLGKPITFEAIVEALLTEYEVDEARCRDEAEALLGELLERRLVYRAGEGR